MNINFKRHNLSIDYKLKHDINKLLTIKLCVTMYFLKVGVCKPFYTILVWFKFIRLFLMTVINFHNSNKKVSFF